MSTVQLTAVAAIGLIGALTTSQARAQSAGADAEIAALRQQLRLMEQKLDKLQKQTAANTAAAASANAKADNKVGVANANAAYPLKGPVAPSDVVVKMPGNRPSRRSELHCDHQPAALRWWRLRLSPQYACNRSATSR